MVEFNDYNKEAELRTLGRDGGYKFFKEKYGRNNISDNEYSKICQEFNQRLSDRIIKESFKFLLPGRLGSLYIRRKAIPFKIKDGKLDTTKLHVDWKATWEYWNKKYPNVSKKDIKDIKNKKLVFFTNEHTDGDFMEWFWDKYSMNVKNNQSYKFKCVKANRLKLANWIRSEERNNNYIKE